MASDQTLTLAIDGMVSERDAVIRERRAWLTGKCVQHVTVEYRRELERKAAELYSLPKIERSRVVADPHGHFCDWRARERQLEFRVYPGGALWAPMLGFASDGGLRCGVSIQITPERAALWVDLFANPTELVDDDGSAGGAS